MIDERAEAPISCPNHDWLNPMGASPRDLPRRTCPTLPQNLVGVPNISAVRRPSDGSSFPLRPARASKPQDVLRVTPRPSEMPSVGKGRPALVGGHGFTHWLGLFDLVKLTGEIRPLSAETMPPTQFLRDLERR